ncbi:PREDICTED: carbon catabolite repressor [Prunus dulcis]|uniref:PREDICTED: carbon catabolite repressor n=1 Tax=Prunus dulcis TaxID=3755 RepID=A0A5E4EHZ5_PRUDU|nr:hypothetical protein L3X38_007784 [Prunus dulcis]VVA15072.1 PREDICTED: carbon catabolite repressor [Prunus dulcis]
MEKIFAVLYIVATYNLCYKVTRLATEPRFLGQRTEHFRSDFHSSSTEVLIKLSFVTFTCFTILNGEIKLGQVRVLLDRAHAISKIWNDAPIVLCGDFNCTPKSPLYDFISEQKKWGSDHIALASELAFMNSFDQS